MDLIYDPFQRTDSDSSFEEIARRYRKRFDFNELTDTEVIGSFRLRRQTILTLEGRIRESIRPVYESRRTDLTPLIQLLISIRYYATGDHYQSLATFFGVTKRSISESVTRVTDALIRHVGDYIRFPNNNEVSEIMAGFYERAGMPQIIGAVDGTLLRIIRPHNQIDRPWISRKMFPAINAMAICDHRRKFTYFNAKFPGSCHDSYVLRNSLIFRHMESENVRGIILGDAGYALSTWLMTPIRAGSEQNEADRIYNRRHKRTRVLIEQAFGRLKMDWRVLHNESRLQPEKASKVATVCVMLHNIRIDERLLLDEDFNEVVPDDDFVNDEPIQDNAIATRRAYIQENFQ